MTRHRAFQTAAGRRRKDPIVWEIDEVSIRLRPQVDLMDLADLMEQLGAKEKEAETDGLKNLAERRELLTAIIASFVEMEDVERFREIAPDIEPALMAEMLGELVKEYTGQGNPTPASSSSDGSNETGSDSVDGRRAGA